MKRLLLVTLLCAAPARGFEFLRLDAGARPVALGGAYTALASDANALLYNPAGLARVRRYEATFMHNEHVEGARQEYAALAAPQGWGASVNYFGFDDVSRTTLSNPDGAGLGTAGMSGLAVAGGYGFAFDERFAVGAAAKGLRQSIDGISATGAAFDAGLLYSQGPLAAGAAVLNAGPDARYQVQEEKLPLTVRGGAAWLSERLIISADVVKARDEKAALHAGLELALDRRLPLRVGYTTRDQAGENVTAGAGYRSQDFAVDYAFAPYGALGLAHRMSATVRWGK